ncbi:hypothetical protein MHU86_11057 [Fragilaria crotonensis]|nr:hypothetical protein MHU86_11057 [Fragilaria crotonensis]
MMKPSKTHTNRYPELQLLSSDIEDAINRRKTHENAAEKAIKVIGDLLDNADTFLAQLESDEVLGSAIVRCCQELADVIGNLAGEMDGQSDQEKRAMARACLEDVRSAVPPANENVASNDTTHQEQLATMSENEMIDALSGATSLMRDIEASLRSIDSNEADEIADVALVTARLFILSLKSMHSTLTPERLLAAGQSGSASRDLEFSSRIEILHEEDCDDEADEQQAKETLETRSRGRHPVDRVRVCWPPLGPAVVAAAHWGKEEAAKKPILAAALGLTLWPVAMITALIGTPIVLADCVMQHVYDSLSNGPIVQSVERGAAQVYHAGRLSFLCSGLVVKQTLRVASRQVKRHGGAGKLAQDVGSALLNRVMHPLETACMAWDGVCMGASAIRDGVGFVHDTVDRHREQVNQAEMVQ